MVDTTVRAEYLNRAEAAERCRVPVSSFDKLRRDGLVPEPDARMGKHLLWQEWPALTEAGDEAACETEEPPGHQGVLRGGSDRRRSGDLTIFSDLGDAFALYLCVQHASDQVFCRVVAVVRSWFLGRIWPGL